MIDSTVPKVWGIHTMDDNLFLKGNVIAIGWPQLGDLSKLPPTREAFREKYEEVYPDSKKAAVPTSSGMPYRFIHEAKIGDYVIYPSKSDRMINIGIIEGDYSHNTNHYDYHQQRRVKWLKHVPRTKFSQGALYEIGSALSFFQVRNYADEFLSVLSNDIRLKEKPYEIDETVAITAQEIMESTIDFILKQLSRLLKDDQFEEFVADLLQAMGYRTEVTPAGGDSGIDIIAYKDELPPRILVQVKSVDKNINESTIQSLKGAMREGDYGLFVTLSDYTLNAKKYLDNTPILRGINGLDLAKLVLRHYSQLSEKSQKVIPMKNVYIPVQGEDDEVI